MPAWLIPAIQAASTIGTGYMGYKGQKETNEANRKIAREAQAFDLKMWNLQNQYNDPTNQMQRLKNAGLNPNLVYGSGNVTGNISSVPPRGREYEYKSPLPQLGSMIMPNLLDVLGRYQDYKLKNVEIDNAEKTRSILGNKVLESFYDSQIKGEQHEKWLMDNSLRTFDGGYEKEVKARNAKFGRWNLMNELTKTQTLKALQEIKNLQTANTLKELEIDRNSELAPYSMTTKDHILYRMLLKSFGKADDWASEQFQKRFKVDHGENFYGSGGSW